MSKKHIRILVTSMVELETELPVEEALGEFSIDSKVSLLDTANVRVIDTEMRDIERVSYIQYSKDGKHSVLKPIKNSNDEIRY